jgi:hypothetical protein
MRSLCVAVAVATALLIPRSAFAQTISTQSFPRTAGEVVSVDQSTAESDLSSARAAQQAEVERWIEEFSAWKVWWAEWANRPEPGWFSASRPRRAKPTPPAWLSTQCAQIVDNTHQLAPACALLAEWQLDPVTAMSRYAHVAALQGKEDDTKTIWWEHIHLDLLWPTTQVGSDVLGVVGVHTATQIKGRLQIFLTPAVMLLNLPAADGTRVWKLAAAYGLGYRLFDFTFPGSRPASVHFNFAKSWLMSDTRDLPVARNLDFVGLSITFKRR